MDQEHELIEYRTAGDSVAVIAAKLKKSPDAIKQKLRRLGLKVVPSGKSYGGSTTSELILPEELPSIEEALKVFVAAWKELQKPGLTKTEILRLRTIAQVAGAYQVKVGEYIDYRGIEVKVEELTRELEKRGA